MEKGKVDNTVWYNWFLSNFFLKRHIHNGNINVHIYFWSKMHRLLNIIKGLSLEKRTGLKRTAFYHFISFFHCDLNFAMKMFYSLLYVKRIFLKIVFSSRFTFLKNHCIIKGSLN